MKKLLLFLSLIFCMHTFSYASFPVSETENPKNDTELNLFESVNSSIAATTVAGGGKGMSVAALVCGIVGLFFGGLILGPLAIVFGAIGMKRDGRGMAIAGLVCGIVATLFSLLILAAVLSL
ncbi:DUF4190 domain-containing protein [Bacteroidota bacterium]|nr:DUF4190 domain-containing protein [Bacteroidota bacterium]